MFIKTGYSENANSELAIKELINQIADKDSGLLVFFFSAEHDYNIIDEAMKSTNIPYMGCMDAGRMVTEKYLLNNSIVGMSISNAVIEKISIEIISSSLNNKIEAKEEAKSKLASSAKKINMDLKNLDPLRDFIINLPYGLGSASSILDGQTEIAFDLSSVGGSSGGKTDFQNTAVLTSSGSGNISAFALIRLKPNFSFIIDRVSSFDKLENIELEVTKLENPREIVEFNTINAAKAYSDALKIPISELSPEIFASYTLGLEPGDGEKLITAIMMKTKNDHFLTYNDVVIGSKFSIFKAKSQIEDRTKFLNRLINDIQKNNKEIIGFISFDCILCYLARNNLKEVEKIHNVYSKILSNIPKIGFGTFSENQNGANVNQTETCLVILKNN